MEFSADNKHRHISHSPQKIKFHTSPILSHTQPCRPPLPPHPSWRNSWFNKFNNPLMKTARLALIQP